jgi:hypothetical protein
VANLLQHTDIEMATMKVERLASSVEGKLRIDEITDENVPSLIEDHVSLKMRLPVEDR